MKSGRSAVTVVTGAAEVAMEIDVPAAAVADALVAVRRVAMAQVAHRVVIVAEVATVSNAEVHAASEIVTAVVVEMMPAHSASGSRSRRTFR